MPTDASHSTSQSWVPNAILSSYYAARARGHVPGFGWADRVAHWALRIPLAGLLLYYGLDKFPAVFTEPGSYGVPALLFILAGFAEILGPVALVLGGIVETWRPASGKLRLIGDGLTRGGAFAGVAAVGGVIAFFYWGALTIADLQVMALGLSAFLLLRGNKYGKTQA